MSTIVDDRDLIKKGDCDRCKTLMAEQIQGIKTDIQDLKIATGKIDVRLENMDTSMQEVKSSINDLRKSDKDRLWDLIKMLVPSILAFGAAWVLKG